MDRLLAAGLGATGAGIVLLAVLTAIGSVRHPSAAATATSPTEFVAIGGALVLLTAGFVATVVRVLDAGAGQGRSSR